MVVAVVAEVVVVVVVNTRMLNTGTVVMPALSGPWEVGAGGEMGVG